MNDTSDREIEWESMGKEEITLLVKCTLSPLFTDSTLYRLPYTLSIVCVSLIEGRLGLSLILLRWNHSLCRLLHSHSIHSHHRHSILHSLIGHSTVSSVHST